MENIHILPDGIFNDKLKHVCKTMRLVLVSRLKDKVGVYAAVLKDAQGRKYLFACKRYIYWGKEAYGIVSFTRHLVVDAKVHGWTLLMLIEEKTEEGARDYIYTFNPEQVLEHQHSFPNSFNTQDMINLDITLAINMETTRRKEILEARVSFKPQEKQNKQQDKYQISLTRYV